MTTLELAGDLDVLSRLIAVRETAMVRPPGLHQSAIVSYMVKSLGARYGTITDPEDDDDPTTRHLYWVLGQGWEQTVKDALMASGVAGFTPDPVQVDGIWLTPDWLRRRSPIVDEMKYTTISMREGLDNPKLQKYVWQGLAYCRAYDRRVLKLHVCFACGDWKAHAFPHYRVFTLRPTPRDLDENWRRFTINAKDLQEGTV